jgi:phenylalanyl-tRNA synthetase beta chain
LKFSYNWLAELVDGLDMPPAGLTRLITMKTAECEGFAPHGAWFAEIVAARVLTVEPIAGSHNVVAEIDAGPRHGRRRVVCGAPNCRPGMVSAWVPPGVVIAGQEIRRAVIAGVESDGMLASGAELGCNRDHSGIVELEADPGGPLPGIRPDFLIEVDNKSLTHRPDLWGHHGIAREVAAITGARLRDPVDMALIPAAAGAWHVEIADYTLAPRYSALVFENVTVGPSPLWLAARLEAIGLNPISNIVDVTNLVMAEIAQPMHAFDADKLRGETIYVRPARDGEAFHALNGEHYTLGAANLVIADTGGAVALAGVIGGMESSIGPATRRIVLESANFQAAGIRKTSAALKLRTDASIRFEKAQDPVNTVRGLARAVELLRLVSPGIRLVGGLVDAWQPPPPPAPIRLPLDWLDRKLGRHVAPAEVRGILEALEFGVHTAEPGVFSVSVPSWRATRDITIKVDLLEEVGRMLGYGSVPLQAPLQPVRRPWVNAERNFHHALRGQVAAQGFTETYNYSFLSEETARRFSMPPEQHLRVANPISSEQSLMRLSLLPGLHRNIQENAKRFEEFRLFEIGNEIHPRPAALPEEIPHLMAAIYSKGDGTAAFYELKRLADCLMPGVTTQTAAARPYEHPARVATLTWRGEQLGRLYELHPEHVEAGRATVLDVDLAVLYRLGPLPVRYQPLRRYPSSAFDLSVVTGLRDLAGDAAAVIAAAAGPDATAEFLYRYQGAPLPTDRQSLTYRITVSAPDHTLSSEEVNAVRTGIITALRAAGYDLRL